MSEEAAESEASAASDPPRITQDKVYRVGNGKAYHHDGCHHLRRAETKGNLALRLCTCVQISGPGRDLDLHLGDDKTLHQSTRCSLYHAPCASQARARVLCAKLCCCPRTWPARDPGAMQRQAKTFITLHTALFTLHTCTSHSTLHLISDHVSSSHLISPPLSSSHLIPSLLTCHPSKFFWTVFISSEHWSTFLISSKLFSSHLSCSARQKTLTASTQKHLRFTQEKPLEGNFAL